MKNFKHSSNNILGLQCLHHLTRTLLVPNGSLRSKETVMAQSPGNKACLGFKSSVDPSLFLYFNNTTIINLLLYVHAIIITGNSPSSIASLITSLSLEFELKDLGTICYFLGLQLALTSFSLSITQTKYATDLLHKHNKFHSKPSKTPFATARLSPTEHSPC